MKAPFRRFKASTFQHFNSFFIRLTPALFVSIGSLAARAEFPQTDNHSTRSISGQFIAIAPAQFSPLAGTPRIAADTNFVRLETGLLVVSAERIKNLLDRRLAIPTDLSRRGQIYLVVHPAKALDENVTIFSQITPGGCSYRVDLPDVLARWNFTRALTSVILLEFANRNAQAHSAEIPAWFTDGLSGEMLAAGSPEIILSVPDKVFNGLPIAKINATQRGLDALAQTRQVLGNVPPLTFEQLSDPTAAQLAGDGDGAYRASAGLFVSELLKLNNGPRRMRTMLQSLPDFYNWQTAFQSAFRDEFPRPLDLEKW